MSAPSTRLAPGYSFRLASRSFARGLFRLREVLDEVLQARLGERGLPELHRKQGFLAERGQHLAAARVGDDDLPELLHRLLEILPRLVGLARVGARHAEVGLPIQYCELSARGESGKRRTKSRKPDTASG
jgi:hypothetical protein